MDTKTEKAFYFEYNNKTYHIQISTQSRVSDLKNQMQAISLIPLNDYTVFINNSQVVDLDLISDIVKKNPQNLPIHIDLLQPQKTQRVTVVSPKQTIQKCTVKIDMGKGVAPFNVNLMPDETVGDLKKMLKSHLFDEESTFNVRFASKTSFIKVDGETKFTFIEVDDETQIGQLPSLRAEVKVTTNQPDSKVDMEDMKPDTKGKQESPSSKLSSSSEPKETMTNPPDYKKNKKSSNSSDSDVKVKRNSFPKSMFRNTKPETNQDLKLNMKEIKKTSNSEKLDTKGKRKSMSPKTSIWSKEPKNKEPEQPSPKLRKS